MQAPATYTAPSYTAPSPSLTYTAPSPSFTYSAPSPSFTYTAPSQSYSMPVTVQTPTVFSDQTVHMPIAQAPSYYPQTVQMAKPTQPAVYQQPMVMQPPVLMQQPVVRQQQMQVIEQPVVRYVDKPVMAPAPPPRIQHHTEVVVVRHPWRGGGGGHENYGHGVADYGMGAPQYDEYGYEPYGMGEPYGVPPAPAAYGGVSYRGFAREYGYAGRLPYGGGGLPYGGGGLPYGARYGGHGGHRGSILPRANLATQFAQSVPTYQTNDDSAGY
jgi:hypothetical protein